MPEQSQKNEYSNERMDAALKAVEGLLNRVKDKEIPESVFEKLSCSLDSMSQVSKKLDQGVANLLNAGKLSIEVKTMDDKMISEIMDRLKKSKNNLKEFNAIFLEIMTIVGGIAKIIK